MSRIIKKPEERRKEILYTAKELFLQKEFDKTTMNDIITQMNVAKGTIYHYYSSKETLLDAVVEEMVTEMVETIREKLSKYSGGALDKLHYLINLGDFSMEKKKELKQK